MARKNNTNNNQLFKIAILGVGAYFIGTQLAVAGTRRRGYYPDNTPNDRQIKEQIDNTNFVIPSTPTTPQPSETPTYINEQKAPITNDATSKPYEAPPKPSNLESFPLTRGMKGELVLRLQKKLGLPSRLHTGYFGENTEKACKKIGLSIPIYEANYNAFMYTGSTSTLVNQAITQASNAMSSRANQYNLNNHTVLKFGSKGTDVMRLQKWLGFAEKKRGFTYPDRRVIDGDFGLTTQTELFKKTGKIQITVSELEQAISKSSNALNNNSSSNPFSNPNTNTTKVLKIGSRGTEVIALQQWLGMPIRVRGKKYPKGTLFADGVFGNGTARALTAKTGKNSISYAEFLSLKNGSTNNNYNLNFNYTKI